MQTAQRLGAPFGSAVLGSVLNTTYRSQLEVTGLPAEVVTTVKERLRRAGRRAPGRLEAPGQLGARLLRVGPG